MEKKYYEAYDDRYRAVHAKGVSWLSDRSTPIVLDTIGKYGVSRTDAILEIGCGEGRDARAVLDGGYGLLATDISEEAVSFCRKRMPAYESSFQVLDCINGSHEGRYDFIYAVAVLHMLVLDEDRKAFYRFLYEHLAEDGIALICTMGDGSEEMQSDISMAFQLQERNCGSEKVMVAGTSCRKVSFGTFEKEMDSNHLEIIEKGITSALPDFDALMFAVVRVDARFQKEYS